MRETNASELSFRHLRLLGGKFSAGLPKCVPRVKAIFLRKRVLFETFVFFLHFRTLTGKFSAFSSKLHATCSDDQFETMLVFLNFFLSLSICERKLPAGLSH